MTLILGISCSNDATRLLELFALCHILRNLRGIVCGSTVRMANKLPQFVVFVEQDPSIPSNFCSSFGVISNIDAASYTPGKCLPVHGTHVLRLTRVARRRTWKRLVMVSVLCPITLSIGFKPSSTSCSLFPTSELVSSSPPARIMHAASRLPASSQA